MTATAARPTGARRPAAPGPAGLPGTKAPPFLLPGEHFAAAIAFLLAGVAGIVAITPELAGGAYLSPRVAAVTHLFTLGWITTSIMGALYQFLPVALGEPIRSVRAAHLTFALYVPGVAAFVLGLLNGWPTVMLAGAATFGTAVLIFLGNLGATLSRGARRDVTWWALAGAAVFLGVTLLLGLALAGNLKWHYLGAGRPAAVVTHLHVAIAGWVLLVMVGVAHRLLPMFLLSHGAGERYAKAAVGLLAGGAGVLAVGHHGPPLVARWLPALLIAAGLGCFLVQARRFYRFSHRPVLDTGMRLAAGALVLMGVSLPLAIPGVLVATSPRVSTAYVLTLLLGISLFIAAHYYKIVPFLVWYHRYGPLAGKQSVPRVAELYDARGANAAAGLLFAGAAGLALAVGLGASPAARVAAGVLALGAAVEAVQMYRLARKHP